MNRFVKVFLIIIILIYLFCLYRYINIPVRSDMVKYGGLEESFNADCYVIKDEKCIFFNNVTGDFIKVASEGQRVPKNAHIVTVLKDSYNYKIMEKIEDVDSRIANVNKSIGKNSIFSGDIQKIDNQIDNKVDLMIEYIHEKEYNKIEKIKEDINNLIEKKAIISGKDSKGVYNLSNLISEKEDYEKTLEDNQIKITSDISGIVSYEIDGKEQFLKPENIDSYTVAEFKTLDNMEFGESISPTGGQAVAKVIDNFEWYIAFISEDKVSYNIREDDYISIRFSELNDEILSGQVVRITPGEGGEKLVVVKLNKYIDSFYSIRKVNVDIIAKKYSGYKIPTSAIRMKDEKIGVYVIRDSAAKFCEVEILHKNNDFAIIKENNGNANNVLLYDEIIVKGKDIYDGKLIR